CLFAVFEAHAREEAGAETIKVAVVHHQVVEIGTDRGRAPDFLDLPVLILVADAQPAGAVAERRSKQHIGIAHDGRLHHPLYSQTPLMVPEDVAACWTEAG